MRGANGLWENWIALEWSEWRDMILQLFDTISHTPWHTQKQLKTFGHTQQKRLTVKFLVVSLYLYVCIRRLCVDGSANFQHHCFTPSDNSIVLGVIFNFFTSKRKGRPIQSNSPRIRDQIKKILRSGPWNVLVNKEKHQSKLEKKFYRSRWFLFHFFTKRGSLLERLT
jgi:hypothetical protein